MEKLTLTGTLSLNIEDEQSQLRIFVADGATELSCHKVTRKKLRSFLQADAAHLFKGRLQLDNYNGDVSIVVKGQQIGVVNYHDILKLINRHQTVLI